MKNFEQDCNTHYDMDCLEENRQMRFPEYHDDINVTQ